MFAPFAPKFGNQGIYQSRPSESRAHMATAPDIPIIYCDPHLLAVNKPAGLPTLPDGYRPDAPYLVGLLKRDYAPLWVVHRLDRQTSGVVVLARSAEVHRGLNLAFDSRAVSKTYHALIVGRPAWAERAIDLPLRTDGDRRHRTVVDAQRGKPAVTHARVITRYDRYALIELQPETGRTHQIRAHLAAIGYPLAGDELYGGIMDEQLITRSALHARSIRFAHPIIHEEMQFEAPYPQDFVAALEYLARTRGSDS